MTEKKDESMMLSRMRTLLALERNFLAEERTCLAEFRTGLALILIGPPTSIIVANQIIAPLWMNIILFLFIGLLMIWGIFMAVRANRKVKILRNDRKLIKDREKKIIDSSPEAQELLKNCMFKEDFCDS